MSRKRSTERTKRDRSDGKAQSDEQRSAEHEQCVICDEPIPTTDWHPALARRHGGEFEVNLFCSVTCREAWDADD